VNVERLDLIVHLPAAERFARQICGSPVPVLFEATMGDSPWRALGAPQAALVGLRLGPQALLALGWPRAPAGGKKLPALHSIQHYAEQVLVEFEDVDARAADIQTLTAMLQRQELVSQTAAHDLDQKLTYATFLLDEAVEKLASEREAADCVRQALTYLSLSQ